MCQSPPKECYNKCKSCAKRLKTKLTYFENTMEKADVAKLVELILTQLPTNYDSMEQDLSEVANELADSISIQSVASMAPDRSWSTSLAIRVNNSPEVVLIPAGKI